MIKKILKAQIATILVFIMGVLFLFTLISINISRIAQGKTAMSNLTDSVGLRLASQLGSLANALKNQFEIYGDGLKNDDVNWQLIVGGVLILAAIAAAIASVVTAGATAPLAVLAALAAQGVLISSLAISGIGFTAFGASQQMAAANAGIKENLRLQFKSLSTFQQMVESPVNGALFGLVDDPALIKDKFDLDRDGDKEDYIPRFSQWYTFRLNSFKPVKDLVSDFHKNFFHSADDGPEVTPLNPALYRFIFKEDPDTKMVLKRNAQERWPGSPEGYWVDWWVDPYGVGGPRSLKLALWLHDALSKMLKEMRDYGYGIDVSSVGPGTVMIDGQGFQVKNRITINTDSGTSWTTYEEVIKIWINELEEFENTVARDLHDIDLDTAVQGLDTWISYLYEGGKDKGNWYVRLGALETYASELRAKLNERKLQIHACISGCALEKWDCCKWSTRNVPCPADEDPAKMCPETYCVSYGCCGELLTCGQLCDDANCKPTYSCNTPTGGSRWCCDIRELEPLCSNNIVETYGGHNSLIILDRFINDSSQIRKQISGLYNAANTINQETYDKMHEAFYLWVDKVGGATSQTQEVGHIVYVKIEGLNPGEGFMFPRIHHEARVEWLGIIPIPKTSVEVLNAKGALTLTVARFDEDTSKAGPLSRFWTFRSSKLFGGKRISADEEIYARNTARDFMKANANSYVELSDSNKANLTDILRKYGIVSKIKVHYGPGYTYKPKEIPVASQKNKDIYIEWASSDYDNK